MPNDPLAPQDDPKTVDDTSDDADDDDEPETPDDEDQEIIDDAKEFYDRVSDAESAQRKEGLADKEFLLGDQWDAAAKALRQVEQRPCLTINVLPAFIQQVVNDQRQNKTNIKTHPVDSDDTDLSDIAQGLIKHIEYSSNADVAYDRALQSATEIGFGYWYLYADYEDEKSFNQCIKYGSIRNAFSVYYDPASTEPDGSDQTKCLMIVDTPREEFKRKYPKAKASTSDWLKDAGNTDTWITEETIREGSFWRIEYEEALLYKLPDGSTAWADELTGAPRDDLAQLTSRTSAKKKVMLYNITGAEVLDRSEIKCKWIPVFPVWGTEIDINGRVNRQGMIRSAKDPAKMYNVLITAATEEVASRSKSPWIGAEGQFEGHEKKWRQANNRNFPYLEYKQTSADGIQAPPPQRQPMTDVPQGFLAMAGHARDDIKATTGIFDASLGSQGNETSGKAILARRHQGDVANSHYADNLTRTQRHCGRALMSMIPFYYDATRVIKIMGEDGKISSKTINQPAVNPQGAQQFLNNMSDASYDITLESGPAYSTQRLEAQDAIVQIMQGNPKIMDVAGDIVLRGFDFKGADQLAERYKFALIPPVQASLNNAAKDTPEVLQLKQQAQQAQQQAQQQIQAAEQGLQQRDQAMQQMQEKIKQLSDHSQVDQFKAETDRMKVQADIQNSPVSTHALDQLRLQYEDQWKLREERTRVEIAEIAAQTELSKAQFDAANRAAHESAPAESTTPVINIHNNIPSPLL